MKTCYIVGAGDFFGEILPKSEDTVIAADGGYDTLMRLGIRCDLLVGDMDSLRCGGSSIEKIKYPIEKDETDMMLCLIEGAKRGYSDFRIYGGVGGRIDHTFANFSLLLYAKNKGYNATLVADGYEIFAVKNEKITVFSKPSKTFSVFAFGSEANGVSIRNAKYCVENASLTPDFPLGVSNSFLSSPCEIEVMDGMLLVMKEI